MVIVLLSYLWKKLSVIVTISHMATTVYTSCYFNLAFINVVSIVVAIAVVFVAISYP